MEKGSETGSALSALISYLRPSRRSLLLPMVAELGILLTEQAGTPSLPFSSKRPASDIFLFVGGSEGTHLRAAEALASHRSSALLAIVPDDGVARLYRNVGIEACSENSTDLSDAIRATAQRARRMRSDRSPKNEPLRQLSENVVLSVVTCELLNGGSSIPIGPSERNILVTLIDHRGTPVPWAALGDVLGNGAPPGASSVRAAVLRIRRKIAAVGGDGTVIVAVRGFGYMLR